MAPRLHIAGLAGILSGILLTGELTLFMASGWTPEVFGDPASALSAAVMGVSSPLRRH